MSIFAAELEIGGEPYRAAAELRVQTTLLAQPSSRERVAHPTPAGVFTPWTFRGDASAAAELRARDKKPIARMGEQIRCDPVYAPLPKPPRVYEGRAWPERDAASEPRSSHRSLRIRAVRRGRARRGSVLGHRCLTRRGSAARNEIAQ